LHSATLVPPDAHSEYHAAGHSVTHALVASKLVVHFRAALRRAVRLIHSDILGGVVHNNAVLDVLAYDSLQHTVLGRELCNNSKGAAGVDFEMRAVVGLVAASFVRVVDAAVLIAETRLAAFIAGATKDARLATCVRRNGGRAAVGFPDVHFIAANALLFDVSLWRVSMLDETDQYLHRQFSDRAEESDKGQRRKRLHLLHHLSKGSRSTVRHSSPYRRQRP
jgi:hypothetical protein